MIGAITNHLWQSTVFAVMVALLRAALRKNRAHVRYWLWLTASIKFIVPFSLLINLGTHFAWAQTPRNLTMPTVPALSLAVDGIVKPFSVVFSSASGTPQAVADWAPEILLVAWVFGFAVIVLTRLRGWRRIRSAVRTSSPMTIPGVALQTSLQVRSSPGLLEPGVVGWWRPILLVPAGLEEQLTPPQIGAVLAHELCHVRRRDNLTAGIHMIVEAVFWFHPLVWWIGAQLVEERERACDEDVLQGVEEPRAYAEGILRICKLYVESPLGCVSGVTGSNVKKRIEDIMSSRIGLKLNVARRVALFLTAIAVLCGPIVVGMVTAPIRAQSQPRAMDESGLVRTKEVVLKYFLFQMRDAIDQYYTNNRQYPNSLDALTSQGYISQIPADPFTNRTDSWQTVAPERDANNATAGAPGIHDVKSGSGATALDGTRYSDW